jgi:hypothetical protein
LCIILVPAYRSSVLAQDYYSNKGLYVNVSLGIQPVGTTYGNLIYFEDKNELTDYNQNFHFEEYFKHSDRLALGQGLFASGAVGYLFGGSLGVEILVNRSLEFLKTNYQVNHSSVIIVANQTTYTDSEGKFSYAGEMLKIAPSLVITTGKYGFNGYIKLGPMAGLGRVVYASEVKTTNQPAQYRRWEYYDGLALGGYLGVGFLIHLAPSVQLVYGVDLNFLPYAPRKGRLIEATSAGADILPSLRPYDRQIDFVDSYYVNPTGIEDWAPQKMNPQNFSFSGGAMKLGINLSL